MIDVRRPFFFELLRVPPSAMESPAPGVSILFVRFHSELLEMAENSFLCGPRRQPAPARGETWGDLD